MVSISKKLGFLTRITDIITDYFTIVKSTWEELNNYHHMVPCTCAAKKYHQQDFIICFLQGLDEQFSMAHSQVLLMDSLPTQINKSMRLD